MRRNRDQKDIDISEVPLHLQEDLNDPNLQGMGNSSAPEDNLWRGHDGNFDTDRGLVIARDPTDALRQIISAIVTSHPSANLKHDTYARVEIAVAAILGTKQKRGPRNDWAKIDHKDAMRRAAFLYYGRSLDSRRDKPDWKSCLWDALNDREKRILKNDECGDPFTNFYNHALKLFKDKGYEDKLLFEVSVHDPHPDRQSEPNLEQWAWRQERIDRVIADLRSLGAIQGDSIKSTG